MPRMTRRRLFRRLTRWILLTIGLAPVVTIVLSGLSRFHRDAPEWVYWKAELVLLLVFDGLYKVAVFLCLIGALGLGLAFFRQRHRGVSRPILRAGCCSA